MRSIHACTAFFALTSACHAGDAKDLPSIFQSMFFSHDRCSFSAQSGEMLDVPGGDIFGFSNPTDIGDPCTFGFSSELVGRTGKRDGRYQAATLKSQFYYTYSDRIGVASDGSVELFSKDGINGEYLPKIAAFAYGD